MVNDNHDVDKDIELTKDTLPPYLPAIQGCRSVEEFQCLNRYSSQLVCDPSTLISPINSKSSII